MGVTPNLGLHYPEGGSAADAPGQIFQLADDIDTALRQADIGTVASIASGAGYDTGPGLSAVITFGPLRIVHFSVYRGSGFALNETLLTMGAGHRPSSQIHSGCLVFDNGLNTPASCQMDHAGAVSVTSRSADSGSDALFNAARGTFVYFATA